MGLDLTLYQAELKEELRRILDYWSQYTVDKKNGGFIGRLDNDNNIDEVAPKGVVLNARILWAFSAAVSSGAGNDSYLQLAGRAYSYLKNFFIDREYGGVYWMVDPKGRPCDTRKQIYAIAFVIYGLSEFYKVSTREEVRELAVQLYKELVCFSFDEEKGGYFEAFARDWSSVDDLRLSAKDANEKKTMNTHLHVLEAYTNLFRIWPDNGLKHQILFLLNNFSQYIIDKDTHHLVLFLDENWKRKSSTVSYGHDIEAAWLLLEAAEVVGDFGQVATMRQNALKMAAAAEEGLDTDGGMWYEYEPGTDHLVRQKHWWVQAEAMIGFFNAWQIDKNPVFLQASLNSWNFIKNNILDRVHGEWFWGVNDDGTVMKGEDKVGPWKCPYHNSRACLELMYRIDQIKDAGNPLSIG